MSSRGEGAERFDSFYSGIFGERWVPLRASLEKPERQVFRWNAFCSADPARCGGLEILTDFVYWRPSALQPERDEGGLLDGYVMDPASLAPAWALGVQPGDRVLDVCAAPGGKTLVLAEKLFAGGDLRGELTANDLSSERRQRLTKVLQQYVPRDVREGRVFVTGRDGAQFGLKQPGSFDRILLDAPCSGERHLLENESELSAWSPRRSEGLASRQYALLCGAWLALRAGGRLVYSTCALSNLENDGVAGKFLKKKKPRLLHDQGELPLPAELTKRMEATEHGWHFLPDRADIGPIYFAVFEKGQEIFR